MGQFHTLLSSPTRKFLKSEIAWLFYITVYNLNSLIKIRVLFYICRIIVIYCQGTMNTMSAGCPYKLCMLQTWLFISCL
jgi:hypothetical protein